MSYQKWSVSNMATFRDILDYLLEAGEAKTDYVPWGKTVIVMLLFLGVTNMYISLLEKIITVWETCVAILYRYV